MFLMILTTSSEVTWVWRKESIVAAVHAAQASQERRMQLAYLRLEPLLALGVAESLQAPDVRKGVVARRRILEEIVAARRQR